MLTAAAHKEAVPLPVAAIALILVVGAAADQLNAIAPRQVKAIKLRLWIRTIPAIRIGVARRQRVWT